MTAVIRSASIATPPMRAATGARTWVFAGGLGCVVAAVTLAPLVAAMRAHAPALLEDDGFYYAQIARVIARTGRSSFDELSLTNGYHPLWLLLLALKTRLLGDGVAGVLALEAACMGGAAAWIVGAARPRSLGGALIFTALFAHYVGAMAGLGMEVSLFALCAAIFAAELAASPSGSAGRDGLRLGLAACACIAARIDAAAFVLPMLAMSGLPRRGRAVALAVVTLAGAVYVALNLAIFGAALPISSAVKSLGGLQLNHRFLAQMGVEAHAFGRGGGGRMLLTLASCAAAPLVGLLAPVRSPARVLGYGCGIGGALFLAKLLLDSSWQIWPWYSFPLVFSLTSALWALGPRLEAAPRPVRTVVAVAGLTALLVVGVRAARAALGPPQPQGFYAVNRAAAPRVAAITRGAPVAMGDRAGSFAWFYPGPVVQLEGLVNDARWLDLLRRREPPGPELCRRGVRFLIAYTPDTPDYGALMVPLMRPNLTQYVTPGLRVTHADELLAVKDLHAFDATASVDGDPVLRLWRLHCPEPAVAPAPPAGPARSFAAKVAFASP